MTTPVKAEIISIGTELLRGEITDTNAGYIASQLPLIGIELQRMMTAGDNIKTLCQVLRQALRRSALVITSGGLGPTQDDLTREAIACVLGEEQFINATLESQLRGMFNRMGREMPPHNIQQAMLIPSAVSLPNPRGTAPGWWVEKNGKVIVTLPGPPREMMPMWQNEVVPRLKNKFPGETILARTIKTFSIQEAKVAELTKSFFTVTNPTLGIYAKPDGIQVRLIAHGENASRLLDTAEQTLREILSPYVWGTDTDTLEGIIGQELSNRRMSLATMEDFTGGLMGNIITHSPAGSHYYRGGLIIDSALMKTVSGLPDSLLHGTNMVSGEMAEAMAISAREKFSSDFGLSVTSISRKNEQSGQSDILYIGVADAGGVRSWQQQYMSNRVDSRERAAVAALFRMRERLLELKNICYVK
ncbi:MAG: CinA family nicotinamide mononucleotide deamidase-related protein [Dehalococcoidales bacterium]|nr:CinA family nicotinamide mononucleotide deamidase-related protein [Dehalococcoidales bacterium]